MQCPQCEQDNPHKARFCAACGNELNIDQEPKKPHLFTQLCIRCAHPLPKPPARYCVNCGQVIPKPHAVEVVETHQTSRLRLSLYWTLGVVGVIWLAIMATWYYVSQDNSLHMKFVIVPKGCFKMGSESMDREGPVHEVCLDWFYLGQYEVTQAQWQTVMGDNPSLWKETCGNNCPVNSVSWEMVQKFIYQLNARGSDKYRLPTEAEWEYACRGGTMQKFCGGEDATQVGWYRDNSRNELHPVGQKSPNGFGLYDMSGNVWEWVLDKYDEKYYSSSPKNNPQGPATGSQRIFRGGSIRSSFDYMRPTLRNPWDPRLNFGDVGFRLVKMP